MEMRKLGSKGLTVSALGRGFLTGQLKRFEDLAEDDVKLTAQDLADIETIAPPGVASGDRYPASMQALTQSHGPVRKEATGRPPHG